MFPFTFAFARTRFGFFTVKNDAGVNFTNILRAAFLYLGLRFVYFWQKEIGAKAAHKMFIKLTCWRGKHVLHIERMNVLRILEKVGFGFDENRF